jgi:hypothetical protein
MANNQQSAQQQPAAAASHKIEIDLAEYTRLLAIAATTNVTSQPARSATNALPTPLPSVWAPKFPLPSFDGNPIGPGPKEFLCRAEQLQRGKGIPENIFLSNWVPTLLSGAALQWYYEQPRFMTWTVFKAALTAQYEIPNQDAVILGAIMSRVQGDAETVTDYVKDISAKFQLLNTPLPESEQVRYVYNNLLPTLQLHLCTKMFRSVRELVADALQVEVKLSLVNKATRPVRFAQPCNSSVSANAQSSGWIDFKDRVCYSCGLKGHISSQCRRSSGGGPPPPQGRGRGGSSGAPFSENR